ncbi:hypothetical protein LCH21_00890 [Patescibacteria group bacterium]|nr:hypothetical protein [Patescibacteria group bacterium]
MTAQTDIRQLVECAARLETIINTKHWSGGIFVPLTEMPYKLRDIDAVAIALQLSGARQTCDITYNGVVGVFVIINKHFATRLNSRGVTASIDRLL